MVVMIDPHFSPLFLGQLRSLPVSGEERAKKGERVIEMRGFCLPVPEVPPWLPAPY